MGSVWSKQAANESHSRELRWTIAALIALSRTSEQLLIRYGPRDKRSNYLRNIKTSSWFLRGHLSGITTAETEYAMDTITKLAQSLDVVFNIVQETDQVDSTAADHEKRRKYIQDMVTEQTPWDDNLVERLDYSFSNSLHWWHNLQLTMERLTDEFEKSNHIIHIIDEIENFKAPQSLEAPDEDACHFVDKVLSAALCTCRSGPERDVRLRLGTYRRHGKKPKPTSLCVLLGRDIESGPLTQWHELDIGIVSRVEIQPSEKHCVCQFLKDHDTPHYRLDLVLFQDMLTRSLQPPTENLFEKGSLQGQIDLRSLLSIEEKDWNIDVKWALAILLSYGVLYLHGGSRVETIWRRENILFFHDGSGIPLRPFLGNTVVTTSKEPGVSYGHPHIIMLGAMLLEIFLGESLESFLRRKDVDAGTNLFFLAWKAFEEPEFFCFPPLFRQVIRPCLTPATFSHLGHNNQAIRVEFFRRIISPLEIAALEHFKALDPRNPDDAIAATFNLARGVAQTRLQSLSVKQLHTNSDIDERSSSIVGHNTKGLSKSDEEDKATASFDSEKRHDDTSTEVSKYSNNDDNSNFSVVQPVADDRRAVPKRGLVSKLVKAPTSGIKATHVLPTTSTLNFHLLDSANQLFDGKRDDTGETKKADLAKHFMGLADEFYANHIQDLPRDNRIRVAILDTGVKESNVFIRGMCRGMRQEKRQSPFAEMKSFVGGSANDDFGHGTNVTALMLSVAPEADLYIGKISHGKEEAGTDHIVQAIKWAHEAKVDIINMSFGMAEDDEEIEKAIGRAENDGIIIFAAASNYGKNKRRSFPARMDKVICVHASDGDGNPSGFNPSPKSRAENFCTLGEAIESVWEDGAYISGTSYATPVAAGFAANVLQYVRNCPTLSDVYRRKAFTRVGMKNILVAMSQRGEREAYDYVTPWRRIWDEDDAMQDVAGKIKLALKDDW